MRLLRFIVSAWLHRHAYIDLDGCLLRKMPMPGGMTMDEALVYWVANLRPMPIVRRRLVLCYVLRLLGVRLYVWTNRPLEHEPITLAALGLHAWLFSAMYHLEGHKQELRRFGPCMDDQAKYVGNQFADLLVQQL
jgi:hypothetical protein